MAVSRSVPKSGGSGSLALSGSIMSVSWPSRMLNEGGVTSHSGVWGWRLLRLRRSKEEVELQSSGTPEVDRDFGLWLMPERESLLLLVRRFSLLSMLFLSLSSSLEKKSY